MPWTFAGVYPETDMPSVFEKKHLDASLFVYKNKWGVFLRPKEERRMKRKLIAVLLVLMLIAAFSACAEDSVTADIPASGGLAEDAVLEITSDGLDLSLTAEDMQARELETFSCNNIDSNGEVTQVTVSGFSLDTVLQENGISLGDTSALNLIGLDGYMMSAPAEEYAQNGVYILMNYEGDDLEYPRSCIPDKRAMYWVKDLAKIEITFGQASDSAAAVVDQIDIFREGVTALEAETLNNFGFEVSSYSLKSYFEQYIGELPADPLTMIARDGFEKTETADVFFQNFVTLEAEEGEEGDLPLYFSETISDGMRVKQLDFVISGSDAIYFGSEITIPELFEAVGMAEAESYSFIASDGFETVVPADALEYGLIYADEEEGYIRANFEGYDWGGTKGGGKVKYLLTIKTNGEKIQVAETDTEDTSQSDEPLIKCFVGDKKVILTEADFLSLPQIEKTLTKTNSKGETTTGVYKGVHWTQIAEFIGADVMSDAVIVASDGYEVTITTDMLNDPDSLFALYQDGEYIASEEGGRVWFCASENFTANNWVKYVTKIVIE